MDLPSKNMYDTYKDDIWKELGPLDPDWFETLTTFTNEGNVSDQDDLCANQEGHFKTPLDKTAVDSQLFSTPKVFRHNQVVSPETEDEQSFTGEQEKEPLPWTATQSPYLFRISKEGIPGAKYQSFQLQSQDSFDLLHTPEKSPGHCSKHVSESLGAQLHPDMSWTSSLNTPPAIPSTIILSKTDESPCPVSVSAERNVVFVRKLFPSLSNASRLGVASPKNNDIPTCTQGGVSPEAGQSPESHDSPQSWKQKLPDAIEDGEIRKTVASVLDGAENVLSIFFTNSSSALRKVKTDRIKRKQILLAEERGCSSTDISSTNSAAPREQGTADREPGRLPSTPPVKTGDTGITQWSPLSLSEIPPCTEDTSCHHSSPAPQVENSISSEELWSDSGRLVSPAMKLSHSGFNKKKRRFVYTVKTSKLQVHGKETQCEEMDSPGISHSGQEVKVKQVGKALDEGRKSGMQKQGHLSEENLHPSIQAKVQDLDMSQLCKDFAQDFSQMSDTCTLSKVAEDTPRNGFSPSACLSAMKRAKQKAVRADLNHDCDGVSNRTHVSTTKQNISINEGTIRDSGFQSTAADGTHMTASAFVLPISEVSGQSQQSSGFNTYRSNPTNTGNGKELLDGVLQEAETDAKLLSTITQSQTLGPVTESELQIESTTAELPSTAKGTVDNINCIAFNGQAHGSLPEKTLSLPSACATGFKTASNRGIHISSANLERAKRLFEETEWERTEGDRPTKCAHDTKDDMSIRNGSVKTPTANSGENGVENRCQLTASQKADVTELCTLWEKAGSQFEFTQFKTANLQQHCQGHISSPQKVDGELDPDFLSGIDFDDSFSSETEKHLAAAVMYDQMTSVSDGGTNCETSIITSKSTGVSLSSAVNTEHSSPGDASSSTKHISEGSGSVMSAEPKTLDRAGHPETSKLESRTPVMLGVGFKTAGGNDLRVSKKCLSKARALFADLEESPDKQSSITEAKTQQERSVDNGHFPSCGDDAVGRIPGCSDRRVAGCRDGDATKRLKNNKMDTTTQHSGFQMASGKGISVSAEAMQEAATFFKDCDSMDGTAGMSVIHEQSVEALPGSVSHEEALPKCRNVQGMRVNVSEEPITELENVNAGPAARPTEGAQHDVGIHNCGFKNTPALRHAASFRGNPSSTGKMSSSLSCAASKDIGSSAVNELSSGGGFCTASGRKVPVSADALKKAQHLLNEIHTLEDTNKQLKEKGDALRTGHLTSQIQASSLKDGGFLTASGKGVGVSSAALKKAKLLLSECDEVEDKIDVKPTQSRMPVPGPPARSSGFHAASGKPVSLSAEALQKAKALFSDITVSAETPAVSDAGINDKKQDDATNTERIQCGFSTAGGAKVHVSQKNLLKAKNLLTDFHDVSISAKAMEETDTFFRGCDVKKHLAPVSGSGSEKKTLRQDQRVRINMSEGNVNMGLAVNHEKLLHPEDDTLKGGLKSTLEFTSAASLHGHSYLMTKPLSPPLCTTSKRISELSKCDGFSTASGKQVSVSGDAMTKAKTLLNESASFEDTNNRLKQKEDTLPPQNGFQTASGKGVAVSSAALKKAKTLLRECEGVEDNMFAKPAHSKMPLPAPPPRSSGFLAASGKPVAFSSEALQKAKALFSDISFSAETPTDKKQDDATNTERIHCGFTTAGGAKVHVSQQNLLKAKHLLTADVESHDLNPHSPSPHDMSDISKVNSVKRTNLTTASDQDMPTKFSVPQVVKSLTSLQEIYHENGSFQNARAPGFIKEDRLTPAGEGSLCDSPGGEIHQRSEVRRPPESDLTFQSLNLSGCTETQQKFFAQEALDCTKALLEDESLAGQSLSMTDNVPQQDEPKSRSVVERKGAGKRSVEDPDVTGQPPLKRRLLEEFDRTVDGPRGSTLQPENSCPNSVMKDRRVFKYSVSLHPNITRPNRDGKNYTETRMQKTPTQFSTPGDSRSARSKTPAFVPPFLVNAKTESHKNAVLKDNTRTPSVFVPPFKKQRSVITESSSKPHKEEDKHHHPFVTPFKSNTYTPPTKKTQSTTDVTGNKSKGDIQAVALADNTNNQDLLVGCGPEISAAEASHVEEMLSTSQGAVTRLDEASMIHYSVELARDMQDMRIRKKKRQTIRPLPGSLFLTKTSGVSRIPLKAAVNGKSPARYTQKQLYGYGVHRHVCEITSETAESFRFSLQQFIKQEALIDGGGVQLADGGWLIPSKDGTAGKEEFHRALCDTPGVDPKLISEEWVYNHYRWIVWKQASMERSFPEAMGGLCLTPEQVLLQLKYRYDVEVDHSRRPALRKIMEKDDTAAKTLVLCVCGVVSRGFSPNRQSFTDTKTPQGADAKVENPSAVVWLTDGWYAIKAQLDEPLTAMLHKGRVAAGGKLIIHGAQLVGSQDACSPLEAPESLMLKICANSSRPARWDTKLGFHKDPRPFLLPVSCLYSSGGPVGCVDIIILRSYPIQWMERKPDGGVVFRSARAEEKEARRYNSHKQKAMEILFAKIQAEFEKEDKGNKPQRRRRTIGHQDVAGLQDGEELYEAVGEDPAYLEAHLSEQQLETLRSYRRSLMEKQQAELQDRYRRALENAEDSEGGCPKRDVTPVWRLCVADSMDQPGSVYQLNLWRPSSDLQSLLKEGCRYKVYNLTTSDGKKHGGHTTVQLTGTKKTQFQDLQASQEWLSSRFQPRVSTHFADLQNPEFQPLCGEVDLTGYVVSIIDGQGFSPAFYLADGKLNFVKVRCFSSLAQSGLEDLVKPRVLLALSNLQLRGQSMSPTPVVYAGDLTIFSTNPKESHLQESLSPLRSLVQRQDFFPAAEEKLSHLVSCDGLRSVSSPALQTRTPSFTAVSKQNAKTSVTSQQPVRSLGSFTPVSRKPPAATCSTEKDPKSLKRRRALDYLSRIPSPPPLSHLSSVASPCIKMTFNPPRRSLPPSTLQTVQTPACKPVSSPVEDEWVNDEELAMIDTQALHVADLL